VTSIAPHQTGPTAWAGAELEDRRSEWTWYLEPVEVDELISVSAPFAEGLDPLPCFAAGDVPLPRLGRRLDDLRRELTHGLGFVLLRGFPSTELSVRQAAAAFLAVGAHLGSARSQNAAGHLLGHVIDTGADARDPNVRIYQTDQRQTFHVDSADVVGLLCLTPAAEGGLSLLASAATVYNRMLERRPDLAAVLFEPIATDRRGEVPDGQLPWYEIPVLNWFRGALSVMYQRQYIDSAQRFAEAPRLTPAQIDALDLFDRIAEDPLIHAQMRLEPGDMQFVHNHSLLHDRTGFVNTPGAPRHLLRLWLSVAGDRELPPVYAERYGSVTVADRGGIVTTGTLPHAPVVP
jgi:hypothetical protein